MCGLSISKVIVHPRGFQYRFFLFFLFFHKMEILKVNYLGSVVALIERLIFQILQITFIIKGNA